jgi:deoxyguanosine kinase
MYLAIEGVIGVGKTSLARLLQPLFDAQLLLEAFEENPFLSDFYADRKRYAFQTQIFFLLSRYRQQRELPAALERGNLISDYTFAKDPIFAQINLDGDELATYQLVYEALAERIPKPDLVIYLRVTTDVAMQRIALRDRPFERNIERHYIDLLNRAYEAHFAAYREGKVLTIDSTHLDFVAHREHLEMINRRIRATLGIPPFQAELPLPEDASA